MKEETTDLQPVLPWLFSLFSILLLFTATGGQTCILHTLAPWPDLFEAPLRRAVPPCDHFLSSAWVEIQKDKSSKATDGWPFLIYTLQVQVPPHVTGMQPPFWFGIVINNPEIILRFPTQGTPTTTHARLRSSVLSHIQEDVSSSFQEWELPGSSYPVDTFTKGILRHDCFIKHHLMKNRGTTPTSRAGMQTVLNEWKHFFQPR